VTHGPALGRDATEPVEELHLFTFRALSDGHVTSPSGS
jgi:hypothetical protein